MFFFDLIPTDVIYELSNYLRINKIYQIINQSSFPNKIFLKDKIIDYLISNRFPKIWKTLIKTENSWNVSHCNDKINRYELLKELQYITNKYLNEFDMEDNIIIDQTQKYGISISNKFAIQTIGDCLYIELIKLFLEDGYYDPSYMENYAVKMISKFGYNLSKDIKSKDKYKNIVLILLEDERVKNTLPRNEFIYVLHNIDLKVKDYNKIIKNKKKCL